MVNCQAEEDEVGEEGGYDTKESVITYVDGLYDGLSEGE